MGQHPLVLFHTLSRTHLFSHSVLTPSLLGLEHKEGDTRMASFLLRRQTSTYCINGVLCGSKD